MTIFPSFRNRRNSFWKRFDLIRIKRVLPVIAFAVLFSATTAYGQENHPDTPPSLDEIIRNVRAKTTPLKRAVVHISSFSGGDGGGRLYWNRGQFVRSNCYRIGPLGTVDVYDTVSDQDATSFLFHTIKRKGPSFSFSLRMPYEKASDTGYGLSDYFLLEHVANQRFDIKYGGRLMSLQLFPRQLRTFQERYKISFVREDGKKYIRLRRRKTMVKTFYFTESIYINPDSWRFEKLVYADARRWHRIRATSYQNVDGVTLPERVRVLSPQFSRPEPYELTYEVRNGEELDRDPQPPEWLNDPAVPEVSDLSTNKIHENLKKKVTENTYKQLMQAGIRYRHMLFQSHFHPQEFQTSVDQARRAHPHSNLLKAYKDGVASNTKVTKDQMYVTTFPSIKSDVILPYMNYAAAYRSLRAGYHEKMQNYLEPIRDTYPFQRVAERLDVLSDLQQTKTAVEFLSLLKKITGRGRVRRQKFLVPVFVRKLNENKKWVSDVEDLLSQKSRPLLHLFLARFYQGSDRYEAANRHLRAISDIRSLRPDLLSYVRKAGFRAEFLIEELRDEITYTSLLIRLSLKRFQEGNPEQAITISERIHSLLQNAESHVVGSMKVGNQSVDRSMSTLVSLFQRLQENNRRSLVQKLLRVMMRLYRLPWNRDALVDVLKRIFEEESRERFQVATNYVLLGQTNTASNLMDSDRFRDILMDVVSGEQVNKHMLLTLAKSISLQYLNREEHIRRGISTLAEAKERFPAEERNGPFIYKALGDGHFRLGHYAEAADVYETLLSRIRRSKHPKYYPGIFRSVSSKRVSSLYQGDEPSVDVTDPVIVKLAYALHQSGSSTQKFNRAIWPYVRLYSTGTSPAMAFLVSGQREIGLRHLLFRFRQTKNPTTGKALMEPLVDMFTSEERYAEAALIYDMAIREKNVNDEKIKNKYERVKEKINQSDLINELREQDYGTPSPKARAAANRMLKRMKRAEDRKKTMKYVSRLLNSGANVVPVLLERMDSSSEQVQKLVRKILETIRMRQIYRKLFDFRSGRSVGGTSGSGKRK